jgi:CMP-N-acetylneuraminic acid synthetase
LLQPTTSFRSKAKILEGIELYKIFNKLPVIGVSPARDHPQWALQEQKDFLIPFIEAHGLTLKSQDLKPAFVPNGSFYLVSPKHFRSKHLFFGDKTVPLIITSQVQSLDIDTEWDYKLGHILLEHFLD